MHFIINGSPHHFMGQRTYLTEEVLSFCLICCSNLLKALGQRTPTAEEHVARKHKLKLVQQNIRLVCNLTAFLFAP